VEVDPKHKILMPHTRLPQRGGKYGVEVDPKHKILMPHTKLPQRGGKYAVEVDLPPLAGGLRGANLDRTY